MTNMKKLSIVLAVFCIGLFTHVQAQVPAEIVARTVDLLVKNGAKATPQLRYAVSHYYAKTIRKSGPLPANAEDSFIIEHVQKFVSASPRLFTTKELKQLQQQLTKELKRTVPKQPKKQTVGTALERAALEATVGEELTISVPDHMITGLKALQYAAPNWREELFGIFNEEDLTIIRTALENTDEHFFEIKDNHVIFKQGEEWNYEEQFGIELRAILAERQISFTDRQWKHIWGGSGIKLAPLSIPFKLVSTECYLAIYEKIPSGKGPEPVVKSLAKWNGRFKQSMQNSSNPFVRSVVAFLNDNTRIQKPPQEWLKSLSELIEKGGKVSLTTSNPFYMKYKNFQRSLAQVDYPPQEKAIILQYMRLVEQNADKKFKTPRQWLQELQNFLDKGGDLSTNDKNPSVRFYNKYQHYLTNEYTYTPEDQSIIQEYLQTFETSWKRKIRKPKEWLTDLQDFLAQGGRISSNSSGLCYMFYVRYYHYKTVTYDYTSEEQEIIRQYIELFEKNWERK